MAVRHRLRSFALGAIGLSAVLLATVGVLFASTKPDGIEKLIAAEGGGYATTNLGKAAAGLAGVTIVYAACWAIGRAVARRRSA